MHIQSMESILNRKEEEIEKLKGQQRLFMSNYSKEQQLQNNKMYYDKNDNYYQNEDDDNINNKDNNFDKYNEIDNKSSLENTNFKKNDDNERELKKLITGSGLSKFGNSSNDLNDNNYNFNSEDYKSSASTKNSIKVPGRIFSSKKKI